MKFVDDGIDKIQPTENTPNERVIHTKYGFDIKLERRDPYGFIYVQWNKGAPPDALAGAFSSFDLARLAVNTYLNKETFNKIVEEPPTYEKAEYKKRFRKDVVNA